MAPDNENIPFTQISHAAWTRGLDEATPDKPLALAAVRYYRFGREVTVSTVKILPVTIRWAPGVIGQPAHVIIQRYDENRKRWDTLADCGLPLFVGDNPHEIRLDAVHTDHLRIICDLEHPVEASHGEIWASPDIVPFKILERVKFLGDANSGEPVYEPKYNPPLTKGRIAPLPVQGQSVINEPHQVTFASPHFKIAFSLRRPIITHIGWDDLGKGLSDDNLTPTGSIWMGLETYCGPELRTLREDIKANFWTGSVEVDGNKVKYLNLKANDDFSLDVTFEILEKGMKIHLRKRITRSYTAVEGDDWHFLWNPVKSIIGTLALPKRTRGRTGDVSLPAMWNAPGHGTVLLSAISGGGDIRMQVDSWREKSVSWTGISLGAVPDEFGALTFQKGDYEAELSIETHTLKPKITGEIQTSAIPEDLLRNWSTAFTFRPEFGGFSNNSISTNCHLVQSYTAGMAAATAVEEKCPSMIELMRHTLELSLKGGPGYGDRRDLYMDSDPSILVSVGSVHKADPDDGWILRMWLFMKNACERMLENTDETGLMVSRTLTGNAGSKRWSTNGWDVVSFGHYDGYSTLSAYRALRDMTAFARIAGDGAMSERCAATANKIKANYFECFYNPESGLLGGWRSEDGQLHDYAFTFINHMAVCFGLAEGRRAIDIMTRLEEKMASAGMDYFYYGIPANLISVRSEDAPDGADYKRADGLDRYGIYCNGSLTLGWAEYYVRALAKVKFTDKAELVCGQLLLSFGTNRIVGGLGSGTEFFTWEGRACGYEGIHTAQFSVLSAIAKNLGIIKVDDPEWWVE